MTSVTARAADALTVTAQAANPLTVTAVASDALAVVATIPTFTLQDLEAAQTIGVSVAALLSASPALAASQTIGVTAAANLSAKPALAAAQSIGTTESAQASAIVSIAASFEAGTTVVSELDAPNALDASQTITVTVASDLTASAALDASQTVGVTVASELAATGISASQTIGTTEASDLTAVVALDADQTIAVSVSSELEAAGMSASQTIAVSVASNASAAVDLAASETIGTTVDADLTAVVDLSADQTVAVSVASNASAAVDLAASETIGVTVSSDATRVVSLAASQTITTTEASAVDLVPSALTSGQWTVATGTGDAELDFSIVTAPDSDATITSYLYTTDGGTTTATLPGGTATGTTRTVSTLSAGGSISSGQVFTSQLAVYAVSAVGTSSISDTKSATAGSASYDPADEAEFYFEVGRSGQEFWEELSGQTTASGNTDPVGEIENIGTGSFNAFAPATGARPTLNTTDDVIEVTDGTDAFNFNPGSVPSGITLAIVGEMEADGSDPADSYRIFSVKGSTDIFDYNNAGAFTFEWGFSTDDYVCVSDSSTVDTVSFSGAWQTDPIIVTWEFGASGNFYCYQDNTEVGSGTHTSAMSGESDLAVGIADITGTSIFGGASRMDIKAFAYFDEVLSSSDRASLNTYLSGL